MMMKKNNGGFIQVQYISRSANNRNGINLGISPTANMNVEMHLRDVEIWTHSVGGYFLQTSAPTNTAKFNLWANDNLMTAYVRAEYGNSTDFNQIRWDEHTFGSETILERRGASVYLDGTLIQTSDGIFTAEPNLSLVVGYNGQGDGCYPAKFAEIIVRAEYGGNIIAKLIPVKILRDGIVDQQGRTIPVGAGCFYDKVTKQFFAATVGDDFVAGPDI